MAAYGGLSSSQRVVIEMTLRGGPTTAAGINTVTRSVERLGTATKLTNAEMATTAQRSFLVRQGLFTLRRFMFYGTIAAAGMAYTVAKLGFEFQNTMQQAQVAFGNILGSGALARRELKQLYILAAL